MDFNIYSSNILTCTPIRNILSNPLFPGFSINVITIPPKFWRKRAGNKYDPILYDDVDEDLYIFKSFGKSMTRTPHFVPRPHSDFILWDKTIDKPELLRDLHIGKDVDDTLRLFLILSMITGIPCAKEDSRDQYLTLNYVLTRVVHHQFFVDNRFMASNLPPLSNVHHFPIIFVSTPILQSVTTLQHKPLIFHHIVPPEDILWLSFDSITASLESPLSRWSGGFVLHYIFETDLRHQDLSILIIISTLLNLCYHVKLIIFY